MMKGRKIFKKAIRILLWLLVSILSLIVLLVIFINLPAGKKFVRNKVQHYLQEKLNTKVNIGAIDYSLPEWVELRNIYVEDRNKDSLFFGEEIRVDIHLLKLLSGKTEIEKIYLKDIRANIRRPENDSTFNYQFIVDAFAGNSSQPKIADTAAMKLILRKLVLDTVVLSYKDQYAGTDLFAAVQQLDVKINTFQPDRLKFDIDNLWANGIEYTMTTYKKASISNSIDTASGPSYPLVVSAGKLMLNKVHVQVDDKTSGMYYYNNVSKLRTSNAVFDMGTYRGIADDIQLDSSAIIFSAATPASASKDTSVSTTALPWLFATKKIRINHTNIKYNDPSKPLSQGLDFAHLTITGLHTNINDFSYATDSSTALIVQLAFSDSSGFKLDTTHLQFALTQKGITARDIYIKTPKSLIQRTAEISYDDLSKITTNPQNSKIQVNLDHSTIAFDDLFMLVPSLQQSMAGFAGQYIHINTALNGTLQKINLPYFQLSGLTGSTVNAKGTLYNVTDTNKLAFDIYILQSNLRKKDFIQFVPKEQLAAFKDVPETFNLTGRFSGDTKNISADFSANAKDFSFSGKAVLQHINDPSELKYEVAVTGLSLDKKMIEGFLSPEVMQSIALPKKIHASGKLDGNTENIVTDMKVNTSYGDMLVKGFVRNIKNKDAANYDLQLSTTGFNAGALLKEDTSIGMITGKITAKGTGFDYKKMRSRFTADLEQVEFNKYNYKNINAIANLNDGYVVLNGSVNDSSLRMQFDLNADVQSEYPVVNGTIRVDTVQLQQLHFYDDTLNLSFTAQLNSKSLQPRHLNAQLLLDSIQLKLRSQYFTLDGISLEAGSVEGKDSIALRSPFFAIRADGAFDYDKVGSSVLSFINKYYSLPGYTAPREAVPPQQIELKGIIAYHPLVTALLPQIGAFDNIYLDADYNSAKQDSVLNLHVNSNAITYVTTRMANNVIDIRTINNQLVYEAASDTITTSGNKLYATLVNGSIANDTVSLTARTKDNKNNNWFALSALSAVSGDEYFLKLRDTLLLNHQQWNVAPDNYIRYSPKGIIVNNIALLGDTSEIAIRSQQLEPNSPIDISITNFDLANITSLLNSDTLIIGGVLNVKANVGELDKPLPGFTGDAGITGLSYRQHLLGNLTTNATKISDNNIAAKLTLTGEGNNIQASGNYYPTETEKQFDAELVLQQLNFKTIRDVSNGAITNAYGNINGRVQANGKFTDPRWNGEINFDSTSITLAQTGTPYKIDQQKILLNYPEIKFPFFTITDTANTALVINGNIAVYSLEHIDLGLNINCFDFVFVDAPKAVNSLLYGYGAADVDVSVNGTMEKPKIEGSINLNDKTDLAIVLPENSYAKDDGRTIVRFVDSDTFNYADHSSGFSEAAEHQVSFGKFINYNLNVSSSKEASLSILLDPATGDEIKVKGDANLNAGVDPGGNLVLAGTYVLNDGYYDLHYQLLHKKFNLVKGSTITFAGPPLNANVNITAEYIANTNSRDLLSNEVSDVSPVLANAFNQKLPFRVILKLDGVLKHPDISFDIQLPEQGNNVLNNELRTTIENKLQQIRQDPASVNKQVFALLILGRFVGEQSSDFFKSGGSDLSTVARQSVSRFLSSALNQIASDLIKGIDIDLNLNSYNDFSNGGNTQRTDLNVAVSKKFLNDRLIVSVGQNFGIEGQDAAARTSGTNSGFKPDINIGYKLTKDGRYLLRAYTRNQFEVTVDGYVVETGLGFVVTMDYQRFRELFERKKEKKK